MAFTINYIEKAFDDVEAYFLVEYKIEGWQQDFFYYWNEIWAKNN